MKSPLLLLCFISLFPPVTSQLCICEIERLDNSNIQDFIPATNPFYSTIASAKLSNPLVTATFCAVTVGCVDGASLMVFDDTGLGKWFGAQPAIGKCDRNYSTWDVDTGNGADDLTSFNQIYGTCVADNDDISTTIITTSSLSPNATSSNTTTVSSATTPATCNCQYEALDSSNIQNYLNETNPFYSTLLTATIKGPVFFTTECVTSLHCDPDYNLIIFDDTGLAKMFGGNPAEGTCNPMSKTWDVDTGNGESTSFHQMFGTCLMKLNPTTSTTTTTTVPPTTTTPEICECPTVQLSTSNIADYINDTNPFYTILTSTTIQSPSLDVDGCTGEMSCDTGYSVLVFDDTGLGKIVSWILG
ncbi:hypothetical protein CRE_23137 [Caenorhabditis remanei]|uniref:DUF281 domain-containing protein n=1 Tax=Caenorhabditis remanei TaxID=31234 RepID=E3NFW6_CAERE|nr:hypothetical protein CRE_23137 [Caenorhabditis remanei]